MPNRTLCSVLEAMRKCYETRNFSYLLSLIEEAQNMGNRMESSLYDKSDVKSYQDEARRLNKKLAKLRRKIRDAEDTLEIDDEDRDRSY